MPAKAILKQYLDSDIICNCFFSLFLGCSKTSDNVFCPLGLRHRLPGGGMAGVAVRGHSQPGCQTRKDGRVPPAHLAKVHLLTGHGVSPF